MKYAILDYRASVKTADALNDPEVIKAYIGG